MRYRVNLLETWIDRVDIQESSQRITAMLHAGTPHQIVTVNVDFLRLGRADPTFLDLMNSADLVVADGMPLVWASRLSGNPLPQRVTGIDLIQVCAELASESGLRMFLLGAAPGVAEKVAQMLHARFPGIHTIDTFAPSAPFTLHDAEKSVRLIQEMSPHILLVAFGAPKQDQWIRENLARLGVPVCIGVGGAFDMLSGRVHRAPLWMQGIGLEWLYRLTQEPTRLWKRYLVHDLPIFSRLLLHALGQKLGRRASPAPAELEPLVASRVAPGTREGFQVERSDVHIA